MIVDVEQGSAEWILMRIGMVTASRACDVMAKLKRRKDEAMARMNYKTEIVCETLTKRAVNHYVSPEMIWGIETEPLARAAYEIKYDVTVEPIGFATHPTITRFGASPDGGLVDSEGLLEIKCPNTTTHINYMLEGIVPEDYQPQMLAQMACTGRQWCDFISYDPRLPKRMQLFCVRFPRDEKRIAELELEVNKFLFEVDELIAKLEKREVILLEQLQQSLEAVRASQ